MQKHSSAQGDSHNECRLRLPVLRLQTWQLTRAPCRSSLSSAMILRVPKIEVKHELRGLAQPFRLNSPISGCLLSREPKLGCPTLSPDFGGGWDSVSLLDESSFTSSSDLPTLSRKTRATRVGNLMRGINRKAGPAPNKVVHASWRADTLAKYGAH